MLEKNWQLGDTGDNVKIIQEKLKILGFYNAVITGSFGLTTEIGVRAFQKEYNLEETGTVNQETWQLLLSLTDIVYSKTSYPALSLGSSGNYVSELQKKLKALLYYTGTISNLFDLETENAVKRLQYNNKLTTTGVVDSATWNLIGSLYGNLNSCVTNNPSDDNYITYTVKSGDTLYSIAKRFNTTVNQIKSLNNLTSDLLRIGQILKIPNQNNYTTYTVKNGDTLYSIAKRFNTTVEQIKSLNNLTSNLLKVGQILKISI